MYSKLDYLEELGDQECQERIDPGKQHLHRVIQCLVWLHFVWFGAEALWAQLSCSSPTCLPESEQPDEQKEWNCTDRAAESRHV
jgi:hypothetical protein